MEILGYGAAVLMGILLGMIGSGGSILTVPVLVYLMHVNPLLATTSSLFIVGTTSLSGGIRALVKDQFDFRALTAFGIPSVISIFVTRHYILPAIPEYLFTVGSLLVSKEMFLMVVFALFMLVSSLSIITNQDSREPTGTKPMHHKTISLVALGLLIGLVTGLLGAGGGFLIIPFLVLFMRLPIKKAVGTSLLIVAINSLFGFTISLYQFEFDWVLLIVFSLLAIAGIFIGSRLSERIPSSILKKGFGWFVFLMGVYIIIEEIILS
jgi:uncharacterized protein